MHRIRFAFLAAGLAAIILLAGAVPSRSEAAPSAENRASGGGETPPPPMAPMPGRGERSERTYTFQVVLLAADNALPAVVENVPAKAQKALKDLQDFLPYKSYHLVDMAWLRTSSEASSVITGTKGENYLVELMARPASGPGERILVDAFRITSMQPSPGPAGAPRAATRLLTSTFGMELGETVVVGTAKLDSPGRALIVLLSALP